MRRKHLRSTIIAAALCIMAGCAPAEAYVRADAGTYDVLAPYTLAGIEASDKDEAAKQDLRDVLKSWDLRIRMNGGRDAK